MNRRRRVATVAGAVGVGVVTVGSVVDAVQFGSTPAYSVGQIDQNEVSLGNNRWHTYSIWNSGGQAWIDAFKAAARDAYTNPTDLDIARGADSLLDADVRVSVGNFNTMNWGWAYCPVDGLRTGADPWQTCYRQWLKVDLTMASGPFWDSARKKSLACHEFGHTVGLRHDNDSSSCMTQTAVDPLKPTLTDQDEWNLLSVVY